MSQERDNENRRPGLRPYSKVALIILAALALAIIVLMILRSAGLSLIRGDLYLLLPAAMVATALFWGGYALIVRINRKVVRTLVAIVLIIVLFMALTIGMSYINFLTNIALPQKYAFVTSPGGAHKYVVLRTLDPDDDRIELRRQARLEANPEDDPETAVADWGYIYRAYDQALGLFYKPSTKAEGEVYIGNSGGGQLMVEWEDEETVAHFFVKDPGPGDGGEMRIGGNSQS